MNESLCGSCNHSLFCDTWTEFKCLKKGKRICGIVTMDQCEDYARRPKGFKERPCRCEDCLNSGQYEEEEIEV